MNPTTIEVKDDKVILNGSAVLKVAEGENRTLLVPYDWELFWSVWHDHKKYLKLQGIYIFFKSSKRPPEWQVIITNKRLNELRNEPLQEKLHGTKSV